MRNVCGILSFHDNTNNYYYVLSSLPERFTLCGVIAERVNTVETRHKVFLIFGWSLASSPIIINSFIINMLLISSFLFFFSAQKIKINIKWNATKWRRSWSHHFKLFWRILEWFSVLFLFYFNTKPRRKWNKNVLPWWPMAAARVWNSLK